VKTIPKPADREVWLEARRPYFNASDAGALYGANPYTSLADVAIRKLRPRPDEGPNDAMERGNRLEPVLLEWFGDQQGVKVITPDVLYVNGRLMATLDGEIVGSDEDIVEAKSTSQRWPEPPLHVQWQATAQCAASGRKRCWIVWLDASMRLQFTVIEPSDEMKVDVLERAETFMAWIDLGLTPTDVELGLEHVTELWPEPEPGKFVDLSDEGFAEVVAWEQCRQARLAAEKAEADAKDAVARRLLDAEGGRFDGRLIVNFKANKASERVDWKALEGDHGDLVAGYRRSVNGPRVLRATGELGAF